MKKIITLFLCAALLFTVTVTAFAEDIPDDYAEDLDSITTGVAANTPFMVTAKAVMLMEASTGEILVSKNEHERLALASVTKIMTLLLVMEAIDEGLLLLDSQVTVSEYAAGMGGSQAYLEAGEQMSVNDMLKCVVVSSCNDAAVALAEKICGNIEAFVAKMNEKAKELGMENTNFINCTGLDAKGHYSCANDIAIMSRELLKHKLIYNYTGIWMDTVRGGEFGLSNTNKLLKTYPGITGLKTGSTSEAQYCISASAKRDNTELIAVVLGAPTTKDRFLDAAKLLDYGFATYKIETYTLEKLPPVKVIGGKVEAVSVEAIGATVCALVKKTSKEKITAEISMSESVYAPIKAGDVIGEVIYKIGEREITKSNIVASENVDKKGFFDHLFDVFKLYFMVY